MDIALLQAEDVRVCFGKGRTQVRAVDGVSLEIGPGEIVGLVGESGSGKSTLGRALLRLEPLTSGRVLLEGDDVQTLRGSELQRFRRCAQMIFQDPFSSLNPRMTVGDALEEALNVHRIVPRGQVRPRAMELLAMVDLEPSYLDRYPHEFSGGQRQRIGIARAMAVNPRLVIADEAVSALDVTVQAQILDLLRNIQKKTNCAFLFIAHDLAVVQSLCSRVLVMHRGRIVESGAVDALYAHPTNDYTRALLAAVPDIERGLAARGARRG